MIWTKTLVALVLVASTARLGHSRAIPVTSAVCHGDNCDEVSATRRSPDDPAIALLPRFDDSQDHKFDSVTTHWSRQEHRYLPRHDIRAVVTLPKVPIDPVKPLDPVDPIDPTKPKSPIDPSNPENTNTNPESNPSAGLDPTKPGPTTSDPQTNPGAGLDPTKPKSDPDPIPSADPPQKPNDDPVNTDPSPPKPDDTGSQQTEQQPKSPAAGCGLKRADGVCRPSDSIGADVPGQAPDAQSPARVNRPTEDDSLTNSYDFLKEVRDERGTPFVNDKLANLDNRVRSPVPDDPVRMDEINEKYVFESEKPGPGEDGTFEFDSIFDEDSLSHGKFEDMFKLTDGKTPTDLGAEREAIRSPDETSPVVKLSWSKSQDALFTDWSFKFLDSSGLNPQPHYTELAMAILKQRGVDPKKINTMSQSDIINPATTETINRIFGSLGAKTDTIRIDRSDTDPLRKEAFDAYFRTDNGKGTVNLLAFHANDFGFRVPTSIILKNGNGAADAIVVLGPP